MASVSTKAPQITNYVRGDSRVLDIQVYQSDGQTPFNLTGCEVFFTLNSSNSPTDDGTDTTASLRVSTSSFSAPTTGLATLTLTNTLTQPLVPNVYFYDIQLKDSAGNITSLAQNTFQVIPDITTRIT
jgi:hypothetical protein